MIYEHDCVFFNVLSEAGRLVEWIPWHIYNNKKKKKKERKTIFEAFTE
jgi:hypothetical protein